MRFSTIRYPVLMLGLVALTACSAFRDRSNDYRRAELSEALVLPQGVQAPALDDEYVVPGIRDHNALPGEFEVPRPEQLSKSVGTAEVRIQRLGDRQWILLDGEPGQVWPRVRTFLERTGMQLARVDNSQGILETQWREVEKGQPLERFRFRLEHGVQVGTSEVHILVQQGGAESRWPAESTDFQREGQVARVLAQFLADSENQGAVSILAERGTKSKGKIFLEGPAENRHLRLFLPYERAWAALGLALTKAGFEIEDEAPAVNKYWLSYIAPEDKSDSWMGRFFNANRDKRSRYVVELKPVAEGEALIFLNYQKGRRLRAEEREALLNRIMGYLH
ncbi:outer membrane protein assembly factor BamC [Spongiibacter tropicus]|uniref:outer membrane protein assembly factor BamC n=1 Tax=Spongiibacter tropicus TaxID=454602 RepID=UPI0035BE8F71